MISSRVLSRFVCELKWESLPQATIDNARGRLLDLISSAAAGYRVNAPMNQVVLHTLRETDGLKQSSVLFEQERFSMAGAAFLNAFWGHGADLDDGHMLSSGHPGVCVIPAVLAAAEALDSEARDILTAIVAGYEVYVRLSNAIMPSHLHRGFHGTGTVGAVACSAAVAKLMGLDEERIHRAISLGAVAASGLFEVSESGQGMKPLNPANAARTGVISALLAKNGAESPDNPFEGNKGFFRAFADHLKPDEITKELNEQYRIDSCYVKQYPACRHMHGLIDCAAALHDEGGFTLEEIDVIRLYVYENSIRVTGNIREPKDTGEAKFSQTYGVAIGLIKGGFTLDDLEQASSMSDAARKLIQKMEIICEPELEDRSKMLRGARVELTLRDGRVLKRAVPVPKGEAVTPLTREDTRKKLSACARGVLSQRKQDELFQICFRFGEDTGLQELLAALNGNV